MDGWINIDQYPASSADVILDFRRIGDLVPSGSVREVLMVHSLCYLRLWECRDLFQAVYEILEPGGLFVTEFPDAAKCAAAIQAADETADAYIEAIRAFYAFDLGQIARRESYVPYAFGWAAWYLEAELRAAGFAVTRTLTPTTHGGMTWRDSRVEATK